MRTATAGVSVFLLAVTAVASACGSRADTRVPTAPGAQNPPGNVTGSLRVEDVTFIVATSYPVQVTARVRGTLPDPCTTISEVRQERRDGVVTLTITTQRSPGACIQVIQAVDRNIRLDGGFVSGDYVLRINGVDWRFTI